MSMLMLSIWSYSFVHDAGTGHVCLGACFPFFMSIAVAHTVACLSCAVSCCALRVNHFNLPGIAVSVSSSSCSCNRNHEHATRERAAPSRARAVAMTAPRLAVSSRPGRPGRPHHRRRRRTRTRTRTRRQRVPRCQCPAARAPWADPGPEASQACACGGPSAAALPSFIFWAACRSRRRWCLAPCLRCFR